MVFHVWYCQCRILCAVSLHVIWMSDKLSFVVFVHSPTLRYLSVYACLERLNHLFCCVKHASPLMKVICWYFFLQNLCFPTLAALFHCCTNLQTWREKQTSFEKQIISAPRAEPRWGSACWWWWSPSLPFLETIFFVNPSWYNLKFKWLSSIIHGQALQRHQLLQSQSETWEKIQNKQKSKKRKYS